jgi:hypothetical protein
LVPQPIYERLGQQPFNTAELWKTLKYLSRELIGIFIAKEKTLVSNWKTVTESLLNSYSGLVRNKSRFGSTRKYADAGFGVSAVVSTILGESVKKLRCHLASKPDRQSQISYGLI